MQLKIPPEINYQCTGCGKCCSGWSVPMTEEDYERISAVDWGELSPDLKDKKLFRTLKPNEKIDTPYTYAIKAEPTGQCPFLKDNLCFIHKQFGAQFKPAMCQLFPYSFNETPDGVYATVSFISRGAIFNAGQALIAQKEYLESKYREFQKLFPGHHPNWSQIKLSSNLPLSWDQYLDIEKIILPFIQDKSKKLGSRFLDGSVYLNSLLAKPSVQQNANTDTVKLNVWDKVLLTTLYRRYFPKENKEGKSYGQLHLTFGSFIGSFLYIGQIERLQAKTANVQWPINSQEIDDLIYRFLFSHIFAKLYFGAGFGQLSVIAGFNHLAFLLVLLRLKMRAAALARHDSIINMADAASAIVNLEKSLGELKISSYGAAILELLLSSQLRIKRFLEPI